MTTWTKPFEATGDTQNTGAMDGTAKTITLSRPSDVNSAVHVALDGSGPVYLRFDGTTPTSSNALPMKVDGNAQTFSMPVGSTTVKVIGANGTGTVYVTPGRGA